MPKAERPVRRKSDVFYLALHGRGKTRGTQLLRSAAVFCVIIKKCFSGRRHDLYRRERIARITAEIFNDTTGRFSAGDKLLNENGWGMACRFSERVFKLKKTLRKINAQ
ncbi:MAG: hypothetical protein HYT29_00505 [Parcubacteria group bacterium]|nr:hypothetical protein [Parcubacteria group bacterium]